MSIYKSYIYMNLFIWGQIRSFFNSDPQ
uniref:Uncharacterized protein n=1 Tax=Anguilla anguilla TaxID=7936 RepID=A0A0E9RCL3_ANGAN